MLNDFVNGLHRTWFKTVGCKVHHKSYKSLTMMTCAHFSQKLSGSNKLALTCICPQRKHWITPYTKMQWMYNVLYRVAQVVVSWLAANEDQKNLWGPWDLEGIRTFVAKWDMSRIRTFWYCFDSDKCDLTLTLLRHLVKKMVTGASGPQ